MSRPLPISIIKLASDPRVDEILDERDDDNGYWVYLKPGFINTYSETHCIHEWTAADVLSQARTSIEPCDCESCCEAIAPPLFYYPTGESS